MYTYNAELFANLPKILGKSQLVIGQSIGFTHGFFMWAKTHKDNKLSNIVKICNNFHIEIQKFFKEEITNDIVCKSKSWKNYEFHPENLRLLWNSRSNPYVRRMDLMEYIGIGSEVGKSSILRLTSPGSALRSVEWCDICNHFNIDIMIPFVTPEEATRIIETHKAKYKSIKTKTTNNSSD